MAKQTSCIIGIEISSKGLKLVQRDIDKNEIILIHADTLVVSPIDDHSSFYKPLKESIKHCKKVLKTKNTVFSVPLVAAHLRRLQIDPDAGDIRGQILWDYEQQSIGKGVENPVISWAKINASSLNSVSLEKVGDSSEPLTDTPDTEKPDDTEAADEKDVQIKPFDPQTLISVSMDREVLSSLVTSMKRAGLLPVVCDVDAFALYNLFLEGYPEELGDPCYIIDAAADRTIVLWNNEGVLLEADSVAGLDWTGAEAVARSVAKLKARMADMANGHTEIKLPEKFFFSGEVAADARLREIVFAEMGMVGELLDPFRAVAASEAIKSQADLFGPALAVSIGLTLRSGEEDL